MSAPLYDQFASVVKKAEDFSLLDQVFLSADVYVSTNVTEYYFAGTPQEFWHLDKHFPDLAPVADSFWIETKAPTHIHSEKYGTQSWTCNDTDYYQRPIRWGAWFINVASSQLDYYSDSLSAAFRDASISLTPEQCWLYAITLFVQNDEKKPMEPMWTFSLIINRETGEPVRNPRAKGNPFLFVSESQVTFRDQIRYLVQHYGTGPLMELTDENNQKRPMTAQQIFEHEAVELVKPLLLALSFLHCKNVTRVAVPPSPKLNKKRVARNLPPMHKFHTLEIGPMRRILQQAIDYYRGVKGASGIEMALHSVRGHFKTYTPDKPLLGHAVGRYFWAKHAAGRAARGTVKKEYKVIP